MADGKLVDLTSNSVTWSSECYFGLAISPTFRIRGIDWQMIYKNVNNSFDIIFELHIIKGSPPPGPLITSMVVGMSYNDDSSNIIDIPIISSIIQKDDIKYNVSTGTHFCAWNEWWFKEETDLMWKSNKFSGMTFKLLFYDLQKDDTSVETCAYGGPNSCLDNLLEDLTKLLNGDSEPDVELHCEGHTTKAHKNILCVRSPVLAKMLRSDMIEGRTGVVEIQDMDLNTFQQFIRYLYTVKLDAQTFDSAMLLYEVGHKYEVHSLARISSTFLIENLTVENACDVLAAADAHSDSSFKEAVIAFMLKEKILLSGDCWRVICKNRPMLATEVLNRFTESYASEENENKRIKTTK